MAQSCSNATRLMLICAFPIHWYPMAYAIVRILRMPTNRIIHFHLLALSKRKIIIWRTGRTSKSSIRSETPTEQHNFFQWAASSISSRSPVWLFQRCFNSFHGASSEFDQCPPTHAEPIYFELNNFTEISTLRASTWIVFFVSLWGPRMANTNRIVRTSWVLYYYDYFSTLMQMQQRMCTKRLGKSDWNSEQQLQTFFFREFRFSIAVKKP